MDYVVGGVAALISGNVTPNRPRIVKRALTPTKHPASPNVTPKSEYVEDRSIFLSPTMQKKKAIVKKSPKRIFQNQDLDATLDGDTIVSPQADKVKKHLKGELETSSQLNETMSSQKTPKKKRNLVEEAEQADVDISSQLGNSASTKKTSKKKRGKLQTPSYEETTEKAADEAEPSPKKAKKLNTSITEDTPVSKDTNNTEEAAHATSEVKKSPKKRNKKKKNKDAGSTSVQKVESNVQVDESNAAQNTTNIGPAASDSITKNKKKRNRKKKKSQSHEEATVKLSNVKLNSIPVKDDKNPEHQEVSPLKPEKKGKITQPMQDLTEKKSNKKSKILVNPNAITEKDSESEHESDNDFDSDNDEDESENGDDSDPEQENNSDGAEKPEAQAEEEAPVSSEDEEETKEEKKQESEGPAPTAEELNRTLFVGNVPFSGKAKKDVKRIFSKYGQIETVRIRSIPIKDSRDTPKLAVIKNELHPDRTTVNVYVKFAQHEDREMALAENGTVLNKCHLRVTRADTTGAEHDHNLAVYIGNMPFALEDEALRARFEKCGEIESVRIVRDKKTNVGKGFGYVNFKSKDGVELALALTEEDLTFKNRILRVQRCIQGAGRSAKPPARAGFRGRGGAGRDGQSQGPSRGGSDRGFNRGGGRGFGPVRGRGGSRGGFSTDNDRGGFSQGGNRGGFGRGRGGFERGRGGFERGRGGFERGRGGFGRGRGGGRDFGPPRGRGRGGPGGFPGERNSDASFGQGAERRLNKRKIEEGNKEGPQSKAPKNDQSEPPREKKERKEFVGLTSEKKKKQKFSKDEKRKKALSEILTK